MAPHLKRYSIPAFILSWSLITATPYCYADTITALENEISRIASEDNIGAIAYGVVSKDGLIVASAKGTYSREDERNISLASLFRIGSISKTFTALGALLLEHQGRLDLSLPISTYLTEPPFTNPWSERYPVTGAQLLEHTAGLRDMSRKEFDQLLPLTLTRAFKVDPDSRITAWQPGLHSSYSNSGAGVVTAVIESITEQSFSHFMREQVFLPLALNSASFAPPDNAETVLVKGYDADGVTPIPYWHQLYPAFGSLNISSKDMLRFVQALLNEGAVTGRQILPAEVVRKMPVPTSSLAARAGLTYGYGKGLYHFQHNGETFYGHGGDADGYLAFMGLSKKFNRGYFVVINAYKQAALKKLRIVLQDFIVQKSRRIYPDSMPLNAADIEMLLGNYKEATSRFSSKTPPRYMTVSRNDDGKYFTHINDNLGKQLVPAAKQLFRRNWQSVATIALVRFKGKIYLQGDFGNFVKNVDNN